MTNASPIQPGMDARKYFSLDFDKTIFLNQGSYGVVPIPVQEAKRKWEEEVEKNPEVWFRENRFDKWMQSLNTVCEFLNISTKNTVFVRNATEGTNSIIRSMKWNQGDRLLGTCLNYKAVKNLLRYVSKRSEPPELVTVKLFDVITDEDALLQRWCETLDSTQGIRLAVIDLIGSPVAAVLPVKEMVDACRKRGILTHIDAAHAPGQHLVDYESLGAHSITGNLHKWAFSPRPSGFLWIAPEHHDEVYPTLISNFQGDGLHESFAYQGTCDTSGVLAAAEAVHFYQKELGGVRNLQAHAKVLLDQATEMITQSIGAEELGIAEERKAPFLRLMKLPPLEGHPPVTETEESLRREVLAKFGVSTVFMSLEGDMWIRLSCSVYNTIDDFIALNNALNNIYNGTK